MGIDQRDYYRDSSNNNKRLFNFKLSEFFKNIDILKVIIFINIFIFLLNQLGIGRYKTPFGSDIYIGSVSWDLLMQGKIWLLITYGFIHGGIIHIVFNLVVIWFSGKMVLHRIGRNNFLVLYLGSIIFAAIFQLLYSQIFIITGIKSISASLIGASGAAFALIVSSCLFFYNEKVTILLFFIIPIRATGEKIIQGIFIASILLEVISLLNKNSIIGSVGHMAHVGGGLWGLWFMRYYLNKEFYSTSGTPDIFKNFVKQFYKKNKIPKEKSKIIPFKRNDSKIKPINNKTKSDLSKKEIVNKILDKINTKGFSSLSEEEKKILEDSKDFL